MLRRDPSMKKFISLTVLLLVLFLFVPALFAQVQQKQTPIIQPKPGDAPVTVFIAGDYFGQKFADVNTIYQSIEKNYSLPAGSDFKNYYFVMAGVRYTPTIGQSIQGEFGGSVWKAAKGNSTNFMQLYYSGGSYILRIPMQMLSIYGGGGLGYLWLNTQRTYIALPGVAQVNAQLAQLHGMIGIEFFTSSGVSLALEGRYIYAATVSPTRADLDFTMKGITGGIQIGIPIVF